MRSRLRFESRLDTMSMRMCSFSFSVQAAHSMNTAPNRYHCSSSQAFEDVPNALRTTALTAETTTEARIAQAASLPTRVVSASIVRLKRSSAPTHPSFQETAPPPGGTMGSTARHAHVAADRGAVAAAVDDEVMPLRLAGDGVRDGLFETFIALREAHGRSQVGRVLLAEAHVELARAGEAHAVAALAVVMRQR